MFGFDDLSIWKFLLLLVAFVIGSWLTSVFLLSLYTGVLRPAWNYVVIATPHVVSFLMLAGIVAMVLFGYSYPFWGVLAAIACLVINWRLIRKRQLPLSDVLRTTFFSFLAMSLLVPLYGARKPREFKPGIVLILLDMLLVGGSMLAVYALMEETNELLLALGVFTALLGYVYYKVLLRGNVMDILDLVDDREKLQAFFAAEEQKPIVQIDPERAIAAIKNDVIGQDDVVEDVVRTLNRRVQLRRQGKPLGVFMFVGATGSGKTELAKSLANVVIDGRLLRFDMNEFTEPYSVTRLIGAAPGYIGSENGGQLTRAIKQMGSGVILFDEIEKAHPDVYKVIMGLMDEARITEQATGETMDASNFVIIMTSNALHQELAEIAKTLTDPQDRARAVKDALQKVFKPEQLARIDEIFCFRKLDRRALSAIVAKFMLKFAKEAGVTLRRIDADLIIDVVTRHERMSDYGVRELVRLIEKNVIDGMLDIRNKGYRNVVVTVSGDRVVVKPAMIADVQARAQRNVQ